MINQKKSMVIKAPRYALTALASLGFAAVVTPHAFAQTGPDVTVCSQTLELTATDEPSPTPWLLIDMKTGDCQTIKAGGTVPDADKDTIFMQAYVQGAASEGVEFWLLPAVAKNGKWNRFSISSPLKADLQNACTGAGCGTWERGDYVICFPSQGACDVKAIYKDADNEPVKLTFSVPRNRYAVENMRVEKVKQLKWVPAPEKGGPCAAVCSAAGASPVKAGVFKNGEEVFNVCATNSHNQGMRPGYNLKPYDVCVVGFEGTEVKESNYSCLCND